MILAHNIVNQVTGRFIFATTVELGTRNDRLDFGINYDADLRF